MRKTSVQTHYSCSMQKTAPKTANIRKMKAFWNGQKWPQWKGYSPCKILSLGQKLKLPKTCEKPLYKHIRVVLCKKRLQKTANIRKMRGFLIKAKNGHNAKAIAHAKYSVWVKKKNSFKHTKHVSTNTLELFYAKNGSTKQLILVKWEHFENGQKWPQCKGYSPCKVLSLGQKIKLRKTCEKPL